MTRWMRRAIFLALFFVAAAQADKGVDSNNNLLGEPAIVSFDPISGVYFTSASGNFTTRIYGYFQAENVDYSGDTRDVVRDVQNFYNAFFIPSARLYDGGQIARDWDYLFGYDFTDQGLKFARLRYDGFNHVRLMAGQYKPQISESELTDRPDMLFVERALPVYAFIPDYVDGAEAQFHFDKITAAAGVLVPDVDGSAQGNNVVGGDPFGANARLVYSPVHTDNKLLHFGMGGYFQKTDRQNFVSFGTIPEIYGRKKVYLVDTGDVPDCDYFTVGTVEFMGDIDRFSTYMEYFLTNVNRLGLSGLSFSGYDVSLAYILSGELSKYSRREGVFKAIHPTGHYGAWATAVRYSSLNLNDKEVRGGYEQNVTFSLDWYPVTAIKTSLTYVFADTTPSDNGLDRRMNIIGIVIKTLF